MVDLGVLEEKSGARVTDTLVRVMVEPHVNDVQVPTVLLDGTSACWLAPIAAPGPANAQAADGHPLGTPYVEGHQRPVGVYFRAGPIGVDPLEGIPTIGDDGPGELVGAVLDGEGGGGRAVRCHPGKVLTSSQQSLSPGVSQAVQLLQDLVVAHLLGTRGGVESQDGSPQLVEGVPRLRARPAL